MIDKSCLLGRLSCEMMILASIRSGYLKNQLPASNKIKKPKINDIPDRIIHRGDCCTISWNSSLLSSISFGFFSVSIFLVFSLSVQSQCSEGATATDHCQLSIPKFKLILYQMIISSLFYGQIFVCTNFNDTSFLNYNNLIGIFYCA